MKVCSYRTTDERCVELTDQTYCEQHRKAKRRASDRRRPSARARGYDNRWERTRSVYLSTFPACAECGAAATEVHHLDGLGPKGPRGHDWTNLEGLCKPHHSQRTAAEQPGGWAA